MRLSRNTQYFRQGEQHQRGFTFVELMVSISIIVLMAAIVLFNHRNFEGDLILTDLVYKVGLSIREAQSLSISVTGSPGSPSGEFNVSYGVHFDKADPIRYTLFADYNDDLQYNGSDDAVVDVLELTRDNYISDACVQSSLGDTCFSGALTALDIAFNRPRPDAVINGAGSGYESAYIEVSSPNGETRRVTVYITGQISIEQ